MTSLTIRAIEWAVEKLEKFKEWLWLRRTIRNGKKYYNRSSRELIDRFAPGTSYNCRCVAVPRPPDEIKFNGTNEREYVWEQKPIRPNHILIVGDALDPKSKIKLKTMRKVKRKKKKLTAGKTAKKVKTKTNRKGTK